VTAASLRTTPLARAYLAAGIAAIGLYFLLPWNSTAQSALYDLVGISSAVAILVGTRRHRPAFVVPWYLFAGGLLAFAVGDILFTSYARIWHHDPPVPSVADVFYLGGYPLLAIGLVLLVLRMLSRDRRIGLIDAALLTVAFGVCHWVFVMHPLLAGSSDQVGKLVALSYPAMDVVLLAALVFLALTPARRTVSYRYLSGSIVLLLVADEVYSISPERFAATSWLDAGWLLSYVLWGATALTPSMRELSEPRRMRGPSLGHVRLLALWLAVSTAPVVLIVERLAHRRTDAVALAIGSSTLSGLVLLRLTGLVRSFARLRRDERAARAEAQSARRQLLMQNEQLREADRLKDEFVALISHDLRTPLTSIIGYLELILDDDNLTEEQRGFLGVADRNADRLLHLVNDLLFVARFEAGQLDLHPTELDLAAVVRQSVDEAKPRATAGGIALTCDAGAVSAVQADRGRMFQLVDNLVSNAIKFTPAGGDVRISVTPVNGVVHLEVADTGIGIAPQEQQRLFDRFFRASTASEHQIPGTGLGLYITRAIVEAHGGSIAVRSDPGEGTSFSVELPARSRS
jgi:signal transduction histidine kinase